MICPFFFLVFYVSAITTGARSCTGSTVFFLGRAGEGGAFELYGTIAVPARTVLPYRTWRWMDTALPLEEMIGRALRAELCLCVFVCVFNRSGAGGGGVITCGGRETISVLV